MKVLLCLLLLALRAAAAIVHVTNSVPPGPDGFPRLLGLRPDQEAETQSFYFNHDGRAELIFTALGGIARPSIGVIHGSAGQFIRFLDRGAAVMKLGDYIGIDLPFNPNLTAQELYMWGGRVEFISGFDNVAGGAGPWFGKTGYLGFLFTDFEIIDGNIISGADHFGWIRLTDHGGALEFHDYAYETESRVPILAGQIAEPTASTLALLSAVFLLKRRSRR